MKASSSILNRLKNASIGLLLLFCLIAPITSSYFYLQYQKKLVRKEVKWKMIEGIHRNELVLLAFTINEKESLLKWKHSREFEFQGEMYDIVETRQLGDSIYYWCWWDYEETKLNRQLDKLLAGVLNDHPMQKETRKKLNHYFQLLYFPIEMDAENLLPRHADKNDFYYRLPFSECHSRPPSPPPKSIA